jgi:hypothetical protein
MGNTWLDLDLQAVVLDAPCLLVFANPTPAVAEFLLEAILEDDFRGRLIVFTVCREDWQTCPRD